MPLLLLPPELLRQVVDHAAALEVGGTPEDKLRARMTYLRPLCLVSKALYPV